MGSRIEGWYVLTAKNPEGNGNAIPVVCHISPQLGLTEDFGVFTLSQKQRYEVDTSRNESKVHIYPLHRHIHFILAF